jgi:type II pantothenate kinase
VYSVKKFDNACGTKKKKKQIGGSLAKVVYFTRSPQPPSSPSIIASRGSSTPSSLSSPSGSPPHFSPLHTPPVTSSKRSGALTPLMLDVPHPTTTSSSSYPPRVDTDVLRESILRRTVQHFPGGSLNFERFETENIDACVRFVQDLIERSAMVNGVSVEDMKKGVKILATGGGAHRFHELFSETLGIEVSREDEMECLIEGLQFITLIPDEVYYFSDKLIDAPNHPIPDKRPTVSASEQKGNGVALPRPDPDAPKYAVTFETNPVPQLPCLLVNIGSGVSIIKVDEDGAFERVSGTSLGGGTLWGLLSLLTPATTFDGKILPQKNMPTLSNNFFFFNFKLGISEMLSLSEKGDNAAVDMLVGDIYGQDYSKLGLKSTMIASTFGKVFRKGGRKTNFAPEDISRSLLYAISNNIGQIA